MRIEHIALWTHDIEQLKTFYETYFGVLAGKKYHNKRNQYKSYFLTFSSGARLELMQRPDIGEHTHAPEQEFMGLTHIAIELEDEAAVDAMTQTLVAAGVTLIGAPRHTGDGYYESVVLDPAGNRLELVAA